MTLTLEPTPRELEILRREAHRHGIPVERFFDEMVREAILNIEHGLDRGEHVPNDETIAAIEEARAGKGTRFSSVTELCQDLGIACEK